MSTISEKDKERIREKIKNADNSAITFSKAIELINNDSSIHRIAVYRRIPVSDENTTYIDLFKEKYAELISRHSGWEPAGLYTDERLFGNKGQIAMRQMIEDCKAGKIDLILTKTISYWGRNISESLHIINMLRDLPRPVGIYFETDDLYTLDPSVQKRLKMIATVAAYEITDGKVGKQT